MGKRKGKGGKRGKRGDRRKRKKAKMEAMIEAVQEKMRQRREDDLKSAEDALSALEAQRTMARGHARQDGSEVSAYETLMSDLNVCVPPPTSSSSAPPHALHTHSPSSAPLHTRRPSASDDAIDDDVAHVRALAALSRAHALVEDGVEPFLARFYLDQDTQHQQDGEQHRADTHHHQPILPSDGEARAPKWKPPKPIVRSWTSFKDPIVGRCKAHACAEALQSSLSRSASLESLWICEPLIRSIRNGASFSLSEFQNKLLACMTLYVDVMHTHISGSSRQLEATHAVALHSLNHLLKAQRLVAVNDGRTHTHRTRTTRTANPSSGRQDTRIDADGDHSSATGGVGDDVDDVGADGGVDGGGGGGLASLGVPVHIRESPDVLGRDQGFARPRVAILAPHRHHALQFVQHFVSLLPKDVPPINFEKFQEDFSSHAALSSGKPQDYYEVFEGNIDDNFLFGMAFTPSGLRIYSDYANADVLIASPLRMKMYMNAPMAGEGSKSKKKTRAIDFLASIEILAVLQTDVLAMQNWDHLREVLMAINRVPKRPTATMDVSRLRWWDLNGNARKYRQTILLSSLETPEMHALCNRQCWNTMGAIRMCPPYRTSVLARVKTQSKHLFQRLDISAGVEEMEDVRFRYFCEKVFPQLQDSFETRVFVYFSSFYNYTRVKDFLAHHPAKPITLVQDEYSTPKRNRLTRKQFRDEGAEYFLTTERCHFFHRPPLPSADLTDVVFYSPPTNPSYYAEIVNGMDPTRLGTVLTLFSQFDVYKLQGLLGARTARKLIHAPKKALHLVVTNGAT